MSEEPAEDVKPKLNLTVNYEGQSNFRFLWSPVFLVFTPLCPAITVKVRANTNFTKIFQAAEVCYLILFT
jgi:hypothetical protein